MSSWFLAPSLVKLRDEINAKWSNRDKSSDGAVGDTSHAARKSSHNPLWSAPGKWSGVVRAVDIDSNGKTGERTPLVDAVLGATIGDPRVWYVIWNRQIWSRTTNWKPKPYTGSNPHDHHVHVSLVEKSSAWGNTAAWFDVDNVDLGRRARARWLAIRGKRGQLRPLPLRRTQANAQGVTATPERTAANVRRAAAKADVLTFCEVANIDVADVLGDEWDVAQDTSSWAKAGSAIAVRKSLGRIVSWRLRLGVLARLGRLRAKNMADRHIVVATIRYDEHNTRRWWQTTVAAGHPPPKRNWSPWWGTFMRALRLVPAHDIGCDFNRDKAAVQKVFPGRIVRMHGIDGFVFRRWIPSTPVAARDIGSDHLAADTIQWPSSKEQS